MKIKDMGKNKDLLLPFVVVAYLFSASIHFWIVYTTIPILRIYGYITVFFLIMLSLGIYLISAPDKWIYELKLEVKEKADISKRKIIAILLCLVIVIFKLLVIVYSAINENDFKAYQLFSFVLYQMVILTFMVVFEELLFKCGIYRLLRRAKLNKIILYFIVGILFSIVHLEKDFSFSVVISAFLYQVISLCVFDLYPSFSVIFWFHFMADLVTLM